MPAVSWDFQKRAYPAFEGPINAMSSQDRQEQRYVYRYTFKVKSPDSGSDEPSKADIQAYINEILGIKKDNS